MNSEGEIKKLNVINIVVDLMLQINDSLFYAFFIQLILVLYGYFRVGKGKYWKTLFYSSLAGFCGGFIEHLTKVFLLYPEFSTKKYVYLLFSVNEINWILSEFSIPYLNMIKLEAILAKKKVKYLRIFFCSMFILFVIFRARIGYLRFSLQSLFNNEIFHAHGFAFMTLAITEFVYTLFILFKVTEDYKKVNTGKFSIYFYSIRSSYFILLAIDICGFLLAILSMFSNDILKGFLAPFHCLKSNFILFLAFDGLIFKIGAKNVIGSSSLVSGSQNIGSKSLNDNNSLFMNKLELNRQTQITSNYLNSVSTLVPSYSPTNSNDLKRMSFKSYGGGSTSSNANSGIGNSHGHSNDNSGGTGNSYGHGNDHSGGTGNSYGHSNDNSGGTGNSYGHGNDNNHDLSINMTSNGSSLIVNSKNTTDNGKSKSKITSCQKSPTPSNKSSKKSFNIKYSPCHNKPSRVSLNPNKISNNFHQVSPNNENCSSSSIIPNSSVVPMINNLNANIITNTITINNSDYFQRSYRKSYEENVFTKKYNSTNKILSPSFDNNQFDPKKNTKYDKSPNIKQVASTSENKENVVMSNGNSNIIINKNIPKFTKHHFRSLSDESLSKYNNRKSINYSNDFRNKHYSFDSVTTCSSISFEMVPMTEKFMKNPSSNYYHKY